MDLMKNMILDGFIFVAGLIALFRGLKNIKSPMIETKYAGILAVLLSLFLFAYFGFDLIKTTHPNDLHMAHLLRGWCLLVGGALIGTSICMTLLGSWKIFK